MTLKTRNNFFKGGIGFAVFSLGFILIGGYYAFPVYSGEIADEILRSRGIIQRLINGIAAPNAFVPYFTMIGAAIYSLVSLIFIYHFFEKTQSPEILFFGFFVISMSSEFARLIIPLSNFYHFPALYLITSFRVLLFGRYFGLFSLFMAGVYAAGFDIQKQQTILPILVLAAMVIAINVPVDSLVWDSTYLLMNGYGTMFLILEAGILLVTIVTFLISAFTRSSANYAYIGLGAFLAYTGRSILIDSDTWITPIPGLLLLAAGTWLVCTRLHREYLWL